MQAYTTQSTITQITERFKRVRARTEQICAPLAIEDYVPQPITDVSPPKWHLAHTTWFFEEFILTKFKVDYKLFHESFAFLFNSYYENVGARWQREARGSLSRPTVAEVLYYRHYVTEQTLKLLEEAPTAELKTLIELGVEHEAQHQELLLMDIQYILAVNPLQPIYMARTKDNASIETPEPTMFVAQNEGIYSIGNQDSTHFAWDNEGPVHRVFLEPFAMANKLVTNREWLEFINAGGYQDFRPWLTEGFAFAKREEWMAPLYWHLDEANSEWSRSSLYGLQPIDWDAPVAHVSFYEANAFANWAGFRLPTEFEWEVACEKSPIPIPEHFMEGGQFLPNTDKANELASMHGNLWEWTGSAYLPYPNYRPVAGALGEYNGKFMSNQMVLRGGSLATSFETYRPTYRNFFPPHSRWVFSGVRLAKGL